MACFSPQPLSVPLDVALVKPLSAVGSQTSYRLSIACRIGATAGKIFGGIGSRTPQSLATPIERCCSAAVARGGIRGLRSALNSTCSSARASLKGADSPQLLNQVHKPQKEQQVRKGAPHSSGAAAPANTQQLRQNGSLCQCHVPK